MSKIEKELQGATDIEPKKGEDRVDYLVRLMKAVAALSQQAWDDLSAEAQAWYNGNADKRNAAKKADKPIPDPEDFAEEEAPRGRRASEDDEPKKGKDKGPSLEDLEEGQRFKLVTKRGKTIEGTVVSNSPKKENLEYKDADGDTDDIDYDKVESLEVFHGSAGKGGSDEDGGDAEPGVGDVVDITTKRGKTIKGVTIVEMNDDEIVFEDKDGKDDIVRDRVESIAVVKKAKAPAKGKSKEEPEETGRRGSKTKEEPEEKPDGKRTRSTNEGGVSVGLRVKELVADNLDATEEDIIKLLNKEKLEFKENTVHLNFVECHKFISILKERKLLKSAK